MPNWKKLILSGSDAALNSLNVTTSVTAASFTGSFSGSVAAPGSTTQVVFNNGGTLSANSGFVYSGSNVGIGNTSPGSRLVVKSSGTTSGTSALNVTNSSDGSMLFVRDDGNVGIGTTSPAAKLNIEGQSDLLTLKMTTGGYNTLTLSTNFAGGNNYSINPYISGISNGGFEIKDLTNNASRIVIAPTTGNVGIGTTSPITKLTIGSYTGSRLPYINGTANTFDANGITVTSSNTANAAIGGGIDLTNNVHSIGSFSPLISFSALSQSGTFNNNYAAIYGILAGDSGDGNWNTGHLAFATSTAFGATEKMRITSGGNVGIGTTSPSLHSGTTGLVVRGSARGIIELWDATSGKAVFQQVLGDTYIGSLDKGTGTGDLIFLVNGSGTSADNAAMIKANGNFGIGNTNPGSRLVVKSSGTTSATSALNITNSSDGSMLFVRDDGNVGIGTTSPANKLVVTSDASPTSENSYAIAAASSTDPAYKTIIGYDFANDIGLIAAVRTGIGWRNISMPQGSLVIGGTSSPSQKLDVIGYVRATSGFVGNSGLSLWGDNSSTSAGLFVTTSGDVGIGTTSPVTKLHVVEDSNSSTTYPLILNNRNNQAGDGWGAGLKFSTSTPEGGGDEANKWSSIEAFDVNNFGSSSGLSFTVSETYTKTKAMVITRTGAVGIGNTSPGSRLVVKSSGTTSATSALNITNSSDGSMLFVRDDGNVGIGTTSPNVALEVSGASNLSSRIRAAKTSSGTIEMGADRDTFGSPYISAITNSNLDFFTNDTHRMRITSDGNVGIGTTSPTLNTTGRVLHINASGNQASIVHFTNDTTGASASDGLIVGRWDDGVNYLYTYESEPLHFGAGNAVRMAITSAGDVGIGTTTPSYKLQIRPSATFGNSEDGNISIWTSLAGGTVTNPSSVGGIIFGDENTINSYQGRIAVVADDPSSTTASHMRFYTNAGGGNGATTERMRITAAGLVGVGATSVYQDSNDRLVIAGGRLAVNALSYNATFFNRSDAGIISEFGTGGFGRGGLGFDGTDLTLFSRSGLKIQHSTNSTAVTINTAGNVLIGTTTDGGEKLQVSGTGRIDGTLGIRASATSSVATQIPVFTADPSGTTRTLVTRTPAELRSDIGAQAALTNPVTGSGSGSLVSYWVDNNTITGSAGFFYNNSTNTLTVPSLVESSAERFKTNISPLTGSLDKIQEMQGVTFYRDNNPNHQEIGFIADHVAKIYPELISYDDDNQIYGLQYPRITAILVEGIKELTQQIQNQNIFIQDLKSRIEGLENK